MNKLNIFIAAPISGFSSKYKYLNYRNGVLKMIEALRKDCVVFSEIENFTKLDSYDEPGKSAIEDFNKILNSDVFILMHPSKMQTSALIELGYAIAHKKNIIIVSQKKFLPFLTLGLCDVIDNVKLVETSKISEEIINKVCLYVGNWQ